MINEFVNELLELSNGIDGKPSITIELARWRDLPDAILIRFDWPNDFHTMQKFSFTQIAARPDDILKIAKYTAEKEYYLFTQKKVTPI